MASKIEQSSDQSPNPFTESGQTDDEVTLVFNDEQKLYVSRNFLSYASPVFEAMFSNDFLENQENQVHLESKEYGDFLDFLLCLHPGVQKEVDESNVLRIITIAEEYQVQPVVSKSKAVMKSWLNKAADSAGKSCLEGQVPHFRVCLRILEMVHMLNYKEDIAYSIMTVARFAHALLVKKHSLSNYGYRSYYNDEVPEDVRNECITIYERFPAKLRCRILRQRLLWKDDNKFFIG